MSRFRRHSLLSVSIALALSVTGCAGGSNSAQSSNSPVKLAIVTDVSGSQAPSGAMWIAGAQEAAKEINAAGGILGRPVQTFTIDTRSDPAQSIASMREALQQQPYAVLGTVLSSATLVNMQLLQQAGVPQIIGSVSPDITLKKHPTSLFRTEPNSNAEAQAYTGWMVKQAHIKRVAFIYGNDEFGVSGEKSFAQLLTQGGAQVAAEISTQVGQTSFSGDIARIQQANPDAVFMYMHETETGRFLQQAQAAGLQGKMRFLGASSALAQSTVQLAGPAADGVQGFVPYSAAAPSMQALTKIYEDSHGGAAPDHNYFKGYVAAWMVAYGTKDIGKLDQKALVADLHTRTFCVNKYPHLLESTKWDQYGDVDRSTFAVKIAGGKQQIVNAIPPLNPASFSSC